MSLSPAQSEVTLVAPSHAPVKEFTLDSDCPTDCSLYLDGKPVYVVESNDGSSRTAIRRTSQPDAICEIHWNKFSPDKILFKGEEKVISKWLHSESMLAKLKTSWVSIFPVTLEEDGRRYVFQGSPTGKLSMLIEDRPAIAWYTPSRKRLVEGQLCDIPATISLSTEAAYIQDLVVVALLVLEQRWRSSGKIALNSGLARAHAVGISVPFVRNV
ncbi:uncharacterized protein EV420DRAFT_681495 [Desarmillaria tabescens]|uniref:DUF6593 domain-containing protein n=1 Tax=Armillaria tabescens TaxID=1929756 RepID=A0AA39K5S0_ARMTA|nr:uncharacterized protein EV420DRAFT_681495 [Desarmillaria tabescens]KAK0452758.1 hypothetical protein EV420DRAFT_681495 [Desarmillaria tabescens]